MDEEAGIISRRASDMVEEALADTRVVAIAGPRQCGKSTLAAVVASRRPDAAIRTLDDAQQREWARSDPAAFVEHDGLLVVDEIQRVPDLLLAIKAQVDRDRRPGQYLVTGSSDVSVGGLVDDVLPGRMEVVPLWPFSQGEIEGTADGLLDALLDGTLPSPLHVPALDRREYLDRIVRGGFPDAVRRADSRRAALHRTWVRAVVEQDVPGMIAASRRADIARLVELVASNTTGRVIVDRISRELELPASSVRRYLTVLEHAFVVVSLTPWHSSRTSRTTKSPSMLLTDSGVAASLLNESSKSLADGTNSMTGPLVENFVAMELVKQAAWSSRAPRLHHFRTKDGVEVDIVAEAAGIGIVGIEVKARTTVRDGDFKGLRHMQARLGDRFRAGAVLHCGTTTIQWAPGLWALPISALWTVGRHD